MAGRFAVELTGRAARELEALQHQHRGRLRMILLSVAAGEPRAGLLGIRSWGHLAACEVSAARRVVLVYAVLDRRQLQRELVGPELDDELWDRRRARGMHGRR